MSKSDDGKIKEHPSTILRREIEDLKARLEKAERSIAISEQVVVEMVHKNNSITSQLIKLSEIISQFNTPKPKRSLKI